MSESYNFTRVDEVDFQSEGMSLERGLENLVYMTLIQSGISHPDSLPHEPGELHRLIIKFGREVIIKARENGILSEAGIRSFDPGQGE